MPDLGKYAAEVLFAYGATVLLVVGLVGLTWGRSRRIRRLLEAAEERKS